MIDKFKNIFSAKRFSIIFLAVSLLLTLFVLYTPMPVAKDNKTAFSAIRAAEHIENISREPHSYYDRVEHERVRQYLIETLSNYLGSTNVSEHTYSIEDTKNTVKAINQEKNKLAYDPEKVLYDIQNVMGVLKGKSEKGILLVAHYDSRGHVGRYGEQGRSYGAMDDGYGVGSMLELAFLFKNQNPENSIYFLFTDAEEVDLFGAIMASKDVSIMKNINFTINLESRGRYGATYMFETSNNNSKVIDLYKKASLPVSYSMATAVYSVMPNFTDFTPFVEAGSPGMNFATLAGLDNYHSPLDRYENIELSSIQHMGVQVEPIIKEFISDSKYVTDNYFESNNNQVFFTIFTDVIITYSYPVAIILAIIALISLVGVFALKTKERSIDKTLVTNVLLKGLGLSVIMIIGALLYSNIVAFIGKVPFSVTYTRVSNTEVPTFLLMALATLVLFIKIRKSDSNKVLLVGTTVNVVLALLTTFTLEGASFLFTITSLFGIVAILTDYINSKLAKKIILGFSYLVLLLLIMPLLYSFYMALTVGGVVVLVVLLILNGVVTLPIIMKQFSVE
ncbi:MAG: M28 family peptidase [Acholeplasma sp.]|nr:M28 family peptidase [Acholeplasma sp.]